MKLDSNCLRHIAQTSRNDFSAALKACKPVSQIAPNLFGCIGFSLTLHKVPLWQNSGIDLPMIATVDLSWKVLKPSPETF